MPYIYMDVYTRTLQQRSRNTLGIRYCRRTKELQYYNIIYNTNTTHARTVNPMDTALIQS